MDKPTLITGLEFSHTRLLNELEAIEKSGQDMPKVLAWRPGPGRAHMGWQFMHCAATHEKYCKTRLSVGPIDEKLTAEFAGGSTPSDTNVPTVAEIRSALEAKFAALKQAVLAQTPEDMKRLIPAGKTTQRSIEETILLLAWHEAHHHGQIHLTWNAYKATHGLP